MKSHAERFPGLDTIPEELLDIIASFLSPTDIINFAWASKSVFNKIGPQNKYFWYQTRYVWAKKVSNDRITGINALKIDKGKNWTIQPLSSDLPAFTDDASRNYYQSCLDIVCGRSKERCCQRCFGPWETHTKSVPNYPSKVKPVKLSAYYIGRIFHKRLCELCIQTIAIDVGLTTCDERLAIKLPNGHGIAIEHDDLPWYASFTKEDPKVLYQYISTIHPNAHIWEEGNPYYPGRKTSYVLRSAAQELRDDMENAPAHTKYLMNAKAYMDPIMQKIEAVDVFGRQLLEQYDQRPQLHQFYSRGSFENHYYRRFGTDVGKERSSDDWSYAHEFQKHFMISVANIIDHEFSEPSDIAPTLRYKSLKRRCATLMHTYLGPVGVTFNEASLQKHKGLLYIFRRFFNSKVIGSSDFDGNCRAVVCWVCRDAGKLMVQLGEEGGKELAHEDSLFVLHMMENHPEELEKEWTPREMFVRHPKGWYCRRKDIDCADFQLAAEPVFFDHYQHGGNASYNKL